MKKALYIFAGANGSGKSTLYDEYQDVFSGISFVNADRMLKETTGGNKPKDAKFGQELARQKIEECFLNEESFCFETVFSHESKVDLVKRAKLAGYTVSLYFVHLSDPAENLIRVKRRLELGGHDVPSDKILARIPRTIANVKAALQLVDDFYLFENDYSMGHHLVALKKPLSTIVINVDAPRWARDLVRIGNKTKSAALKNTLPGMRSEQLKLKRYKICIRCDRSLRGNIRIFHGVCSICEPKING